MSCKMTREDFDRAAAAITGEEFKSIAWLGSAARKFFAEAGENVARGLHQAFPAMSGPEAEFCLWRLRQECRDMVFQMFRLITGKKD